MTAGGIGVRGPVPPVDGELVAALAGVGWLLRHGLLSRLQADSAMDMIRADLELAQLRAEWPRYRIWRQQIWDRLVLIAEDSAGFSVQVRSADQLRRALAHKCQGPAGRVARNPMPMPRPAGWQGGC